MIKSKKELRFYIMADSMMNSGCFKRSFNRRFRDFWVPDYNMRFLRAMRKASYFSHQNGLINRFLGGYYKLRQRKFGLKLGWSIASDAFGYGLLLPHYGTIVVGPNNIGNYAVLQTSTCISGNMKTIGDALYVSTGAKLTNKVVLGDNVTIAANSVVTKSFPNGNVLLAGMPATVLKSSDPWYIRDGVEYAEKVKRIEELKMQMGL